MDISSGHSVSEDKTGTALSEAYLCKFEYRKPPQLHSTKLLANTNSRMCATVCLANRSHRLFLHEELSFVFFYRSPLQNDVVHGRRHIRLRCDWRWHRWMCALLQ